MSQETTPNKNPTIPVDEEAGKPLFPASFSGHRCGPRRGWHVSLRRLFSYARKHGSFAVKDAAVYLCVSVKDVYYLLQRYRRALWIICGVFPDYRVRMKKHDPGRVASLAPVHWNENMRRVLDAWGLVFVFTGDAPPLGDEIGPLVDEDLPELVKPTPPEAPEPLKPLVEEPRESGIKPLDLESQVLRASELPPEGFPRPDREPSHHWFWFQSRA